MSYLTSSSEWPYEVRNYSNFIGERKVKAVKYLDQEYSYLNAEIEIKT